MSDPMTTRASLVDRPAQIHTLKCWPEFFRAVVDGQKRFEIRNDDRSFQVGDCLVLQEFNPETETYTGEMTSQRVTYMTNAFLPESYVCLSIEPWIKPTDAEKWVRDAAAALASHSQHEHGLWTCGCGWVNGPALARCARCNRTPEEGGAVQIAEGAVLAGPSWQPNLPALSALERDMRAAGERSQFYEDVLTKLADRLAALLPDPPSEAPHAR